MAIIIDMPQAVSRDSRYGEGVRLVNTHTGVTTETLVTNERTLETLLPEFVVNSTPGSPGFNNFQRLSALCVVAGGSRDTLAEWIESVGLDTSSAFLADACDMNFAGEPHNSISDRLGYNPFR